RSASWLLYSKQLADRFPFAQPERPGGLVSHFGGRVDAEAPEDCRCEVAGRDGVGRGVSADLVAGAENTATGDSAHRENRGITDRPGVAAAVAVDLRSAPELPYRQHQRCFE